MTRTVRRRDTTEFPRFGAIFVVCFLVPAVRGWGIQPLPRIGPISASPTAYFEDTQTGQRFEPRGSNYIRLVEVTTGPTQGFWHITLNTGFYNASEAEFALTLMEESGYNVVRIFIDQGNIALQDAGNYGMAGPISTITTDLYQPCLENFIDFLRRANAHKCYVIPVCCFWPSNNAYGGIADSGSAPNVEDVNSAYLAQGPIDAKETYLVKLVEAVRDAEPNGDLLSTVLAWELANEIGVITSAAPFSLTSGLVTTADGQTYDMGDPTSRRDCADNNIANWANSVVSAIRSVDSEAMISASVFTFRAVGKLGPAGVLPVDAADIRFPARPLSFINDTNLSFVDVHLYPIGSPYSMSEDLESSEYSSWDLGSKPLLMGEFGAFKSQFPTIEEAAIGMIAHRDSAFGFGFSGYLYWTWDDATQTQLWNLLDAGGVINDALRPNFPNLSAVLHWMAYD